MEKTFIYTLSNPNNINDIRYVGKANNIEIRFTNHIIRCQTLLDTHTHKCNWITKLKKEKLEPIIEIIDEVNVSEWPFWEKYWISQFKSWGFNLVNGTEGGDGVSYHSDVTKKHLSKVKKGEKIHSEKYKKKLSERMKGNTHTLGKKLSEDHRKKISDSGLGRKHSEKTKNSISIKNKGKNNGMYGKKHNKESIKKISERSEGENHPKSILKESDVLLIRDYYKNKTYNQRIMAKMFNVSYSLITKITGRKLWKNI
jgi:hypothetical protein